MCARLPVWLFFSLFSSSFLVGRCVGECGVGVYSLLKGRVEIFHPPKPKIPHISSICFQAYLGGVISSLQLHSKREPRK